MASDSRSENEGMRVKTIGRIRPLGPVPPFSTFRRNSKSQACSSRSLRPRAGARREVTSSRIVADVGQPVLLDRGRVVLDAVAAPAVEGLQARRPAASVRASASFTFASMRAEISRGRLDRTNVDMPGPGHR